MVNIHASSPARSTIKTKIKQAKAFGKNRPADSVGNISVARVLQIGAMDLIPILGQTLRLKLCKSFIHMPVRL
jgi:hypothetical protein